MASRSRRWRLMVGEHGAGDVEVLDEQECIRLLGAHEVGRISVVSGRYPVILPVNYVLVGRDVVFSTGEGTKQQAADAQSPAAFEVDGVDPQTRSGWSVLVQGELQEADLVYLLQQAPAGPPSRVLDTWVGGDHPFLMRLRIRHVSGRRVAGGTSGKADGLHAAG